ncbi:MAG: SpoIID/LytB domain-containing protein [Bacteroidales bacterium]|nr:SpoIID/LytB domain-containing protein [Bacteroidales bacterium]
MEKIPVIQVGIQFKPNIEFTLSGTYKTADIALATGKWEARINNGAIEISGGDQTFYCSSGLILNPMESNVNQFTLHNVTIGINFHWQRVENQTFKGGLKLLIENEMITAINILPIEDYLISVISSEMSATSSMELLKAHAVISRSWLLAQIQKNKNIQERHQNYTSVYQNENEIIRWYDREDHLNFDVCADDHCQRYQGITRSSTKAVEDAVKATWGEILAYNNEICDARFSKCCGGMVEVFENVWEPVNHPYLKKLVDNPVSPKGFDLNLRSEVAAHQWINGHPDAFCNTNDKKVLNQVLNDYDQETNDFYRWKVEYDQVELSELVKKRTGIDFGLIKDLIPMERGDSGRLIKLIIRGEKRTMTIGKELEIRKALSESHLYSSAFVVEKIYERDSIKFVLHGAGWGHGVGLCQIGAAVMSDRGYLYTEILNHYFKDISLVKRY